MSAALNGPARLGVPQGYQVHIPLPGGRTQLERFFVDATGRGNRLPLVGEVVLDAEAIG
jgi:hypothetical protein